MSKKLNDADLHKLAALVRRALRHDQFKVFACLGERPDPCDFSTFRQLVDVGVDILEPDSTAVEVYADMIDPGGPRERF